MKHVFKLLLIVIAFVNSGNAQISHTEINYRTSDSVSSSDSDRTENSVAEVITRSSDEEEKEIDDFAAVLQNSVNAYLNEGEGPSTEGNEELTSESVLISSLTTEKNIEEVITKSSDDEEEEEEIDDFAAVLQNSIGEGTSTEGNEEYGDLLTISSSESVLNSSLTSEKNTELSSLYLSSSEVITTENECEQHDISDVIINATQDTIEMSWDPDSPRYADQCELKYDVNITSAKYDSSEIPYFRQELKTHHKFTRLQPCTAYNLSLQANEGKIFQKTVRTLPGEIENLNVTMRDNKTRVEWSPSGKPHCSNYKILLDGRVVAETSRVVNELNGDLFCTSVSVVNVDEDDRDGKASTRTMPGPIQHLSVIPGENSLDVTWDPPEDSSCVTEYHVFLDEKHDIKTNETQHTFNGLEACTPYTVEVTALSDTEDEGEPVRNTTSTKMPGQIAQVANLKLTRVDELYINATWDPPPGQGACINWYHLLLWDQYGVNHEEEQHLTNTYREFSSLVGCMTYIVQVKAIVSTNVEGDTLQASISVAEMPLNPPVERFKIVDKTWAQLSLGLDSYSVNMCPVSRVDVKCEALKEDNEDLPWLITSKEEFLSYQDSSSRPLAVINVTGLSEFTNYSCYANATNTWGPSPPSVVITFQTHDDLPSKPQNLHINVINATSFEVTWKEPDKIPGVPIGYRLRIEPRNALHYIPRECEVSPTDAHLTLEFETTQFLFTEALPSFIYYVSLAAGTGSGYGELAGGYVYTPPSAPEKPRDPQYSLETIQGDEYNVIAHLEWLLPCNTNGNIMGFRLVIHGVPFWTEESDERDEIVQVNESSENTTYSFGIENVKASFNYTVEIYAVPLGSLEDEQGESAFISFVTPEGFPSAPTIINIVPGQSYVTITWNPPVQENGQLTKYRVSIAVDGPLHFIPDDCEILQENFEYVIQANETSFTFEGGLPNFNYSVTVEASTSTGFGTASDAWDFQTLPSSSYPPRDLQYDLENVLGEVYDVTAILNWVFPCNTNSHVTHFVVNIFGKSLDNAGDDHRTESIEIITPIEENVTFPFQILPLQNYTVAVFAFASLETNLTGQSKEVTFLSPDGWPSAPAVTDVNVSDDVVTFAWAEPLNKNGILQGFKVVVRSLGPLHLVPEECEVDLETRTFEAEANVTTFEFTDFLPHYNYTITVSAATRAGYGPASNPHWFKTPESEPQAIRNLTLHEVVLDESDEVFDANATVRFLKPCNLNGVFASYEVGIHGVRIGFTDIHEVVKVGDVEGTVQVLALQPEFTYAISVTVLTRNFSSETSSLETFVAPSGVPPAAVYNISSPLPNGTTQAIFTFPNDIFDDATGTILYYSFILSGVSEVVNVSGFGFWDGTEDTWPSVGYWAETGAIFPYQVTPARWNPFKNRVSDLYTFVIGEENCTKVGSLCNGPLRADTSYAFIVRGFTARGFRNTGYTTFITPSDLEPGLDLALILGLTFGILAIIVLSKFIIILWWRRRKEERKKSVGLDPLMPAAVPIKEFPAHYADIKENLNKLKSEYTLLESKSAALSLPSDIAVADENRKKNRYINILPYDEARVKLDTDRNANYSEYINASYIKGYSDAIEYIATQGPLESTVVDFWRMVMQENVSVIVMVAQFAENGKQKCHKYFPSNHENMEIGDGIEIRCSNELDFGSYTVRSLLVQRELNRWSITHLQFTDWPDFGCPTGTQPILQFCNVMRSYIEKNKSKTIVHCSAGVGRTGTLIAVDILLQTIQNNGNINVFKVVFNMRKQRSHMVQTEKQYLYIHTCIKDHILNPMKSEDNKSEPIYENLNILQTVLNDNRSVAESAL